MRGFDDKAVEFPFKVSPPEREIIELETKTALLLVGRSGTGKTTCAIYRMFFQARAVSVVQIQIQVLTLILTSLTRRAQWVVARETAAKAVKAGLPPPRPRRQLFVTASATLRREVEAAFRRLQVSAAPTLKTSPKTQPQNPPLKPAVLSPSLLLRRPRRRRCSPAPWRAPSPLRR